MNGIATKIAQEIRVLVQHNDLNAGTSEEVTEHHAGGSAADNDTPGGDCLHSAGSLRTYRMMSIQRVRCRFWGARASRVLAITSRDAGVFQDCFGETPKPTRETRVLPGGPRLP